MDHYIKAKAKEGYIEHLAFIGWSDVDEVLDYILHLKKKEGMTIIGPMSKNDFNRQARNSCVADININYGHYSGRFKSYVMG